ncbi:MAG: tetratricopeptide repeat protein [Acidobacteriota bacterium]
MIVLRGATALPAFLLAVAFLGVPAASAELPPVPAPTLDGMEPRVRAEIEGARRQLDGLLNGAGGVRPEVEPRQLAAAFGQLGQRLHAYQLEESAAVAYANAAAVDPGEPRWPYLEGVARGHLRQLEASAAAFRRVLDARPGHVESRLRLAEALRLLGDAEGAGVLWRDAVADPAVARHPGALAVARYGLGRLAAAGGDLDGAVEHFRSVLDGQPAAGAVHHQLGLALRRLGRIDEARAALAQAGAGEPEAAEPWLDDVVPRGAVAYRLLGNLALLRGDTDEALGWLRRARDLEADDPQILRSLARVHEQRDDPEAALELYALLREVAPQQAASHFDWARSVLARGGDPAPALAALRRASELAPARVDVRNLLASTLAFTGDLEAAEAAYGESLRRSPGDPESLAGSAQVRFLRGARSAAAGDTDGALAHYRAALDLRPEHRDARYNLALVLGTSGRRGDASAQLERLLEDHPEDLEGRHLHVVGLLRAGRDAEALRVLDAGFGRGLEPSGAHGVPLVYLAACLLATSPDPTVRDPGRALDLARRVLDAEPSAPHVAAVAMALAASGRFDEAVAWQGQLLERARSAGAGASMARWEGDLKRYRDRRLALPPWSKESP